MEKVKVLFVCLGNICRSPLADGVMRKLVADAGLAEHFEIDSAGTGAWHAGSAPDGRMQDVARTMSVDLSPLRARQVNVGDLIYYDHIFVMDKNNLHDTLALDLDDQYGHKVRLFREFDPEPGDFQVPDPYYGGPQGFENVYTMVDRTARHLLHLLVEEHGLELSSS